MLHLEWISLRDLRSDILKTGLLRLILPVYRPYYGRKVRVVQKSPYTCCLGLACHTESQVIAFAFHPGITVPTAAGSRMPHTLRVQAWKEVRTANCASCSGRACTPLESGAVVTMAQTSIQPGDGTGNYPTVFT